MQSAEERRQFEAATLGHLDAAYNLARWLTGNDHDAEDVVQEAYLRAQRFFASCRGAEARAWLLKVVRNTCYTWIEKNRPVPATLSIDAHPPADASEALNPERMLEQQIAKEAVGQAIAALPAEFREVIVLRELEGLSYQQIAAVTELPLGTVMSRLSRARERLQQLLATHVEKEW